MNFSPGEFVRLSEYFYDDILKGKEYNRVYTTTKPSDQTYFPVRTGTMGIYLERERTGKNFEWGRVLFPGGVGWVDMGSLERVE